MRRALLAIALLPGIAQAATYLNLGGVTWHSDPRFNGRNPGIGIQHDISVTDFIAAGIYKNSDFATSSYGVAGRRLISDGVVAAGFFIGVVDGYKYRNHGDFAPFAAPFVMVDGHRIGVNLVFIPPAQKGGAAALSLQIKIMVHP